MRIINARGPVVSALKRHDSGLRVRWSFEKKMWAVTAPYKKFHSAWVKRPVWTERIAKSDSYIEHILPELSDLYIDYHSRRYTIAWSKKIDWALYQAILSRDSHRLYKGDVKAQFEANQEAQNKSKEKEEARRRDERVYEGWNRFKFNLKRNPGAEDGAGNSIKHLA